jgi:uncharacterized tellurite resistance protein B-like protein
LRAGLAKLPVLGRLRDLLEGKPSASVDPQELVRIASAVLLVEVARADAEHSDIERETLLKLLGGHFGLSAADAQALLQSAENSADRSISLHHFVDSLNEHLDHAQRQAVMRMLWRIAYADETLHRHEEHLLRRIADLLHLGHSDFVRTKLQVLGQA